MVGERLRRNRTRVIEHVYRTCGLCHEQTKCKPPIRLAIQHLANLHRESVAGEFIIFRV
ncbi:hypothetical protein JB92DRAFT_3009921 [Gautieria morchelliformis]|nr:hypothetical protein JB92DRAFT_3009921 [Gautieria morchelliformis]